MTDEDIPDDLLPDETDEVDPVDYVGGVGTGLLAAGISLTFGPAIAPKTLLLTGGILFVGVFAFNVTRRGPS